MATVLTSLSIVCNILSIAMYATAMVYLVVLVSKRQALQQPPFLALVATAIITHGISLHGSLIHSGGVDLSLSNALSLVSLSINLIVFISSFKKPLHNIFLLLLPLTALTLTASFFSSPNTTEVSLISAGLGLHVALSIISYSLLFIAVLQALLLYWQDKQLKQRRLYGLLYYFPPLQTMETLMFEILWIGVIVLAAAIMVGMFYIDDIFAQHLAHKTLLSMIAWVTFATLLFGRLRWGWRSHQAIRWVLVGFCFLMLAYFGSKIVLEMILH